MEDTIWKFYLNSEEAWEAMLDAISHASLSIDIEQYIFLHDGIGSRFFELLKDKARSGIKIRILCDEFGSFAFAGTPEVKKVIDAGIELKFFNPLLPWNPNREAMLYFRDHRKLMIIDNRTGFTGSVCFADEMKLWRESHVKIIGPVVAEMHEAFEVMWNKQYRKLKYIFKRKKKDQELKEFRYISNAPLPQKRFMYYELLRAINNATHYIYLTTPYFLPNSRLLRVIKKASSRGVEIRLLVPKTTNHLVAHIGAQTFFTDLLKHKIRIFRYDQMIHSKTIVIDGRWSTIGSLNLDNISLRYNFEANLVSTNKNFTFELEKQFLDDLHASKELKLSEWLYRSWSQKVLEILIWPFRKFI